MTKYVLALALATFGWALPLGAAEPATAPTTAATQQADPKALAQATLEKLTKKYGQGLIYEIDDKLKIIFATSADRHTLEEIKDLMGAHAAALHRDMFEHLPENYISVIIPAKWANPRVTGHFWGDWCDAATIGSDLRHEFTHALHWADQRARGQEHPVWLMEGLATLYEDSRVIDGHAVPRPNHRIVELQQEVSHGQFVPFAKMLGFAHKDFRSDHYAQARYMLMYLYDTKQLKKFYDLYCAGFDKDPTGAAALEQVYGKKLDDIQKDWVTWLLAQKPPKFFVGPGQASLGIATSQIPDGSRIEQLLPEGGAAKAGLKPGDVILAIDDERTINGEDLVFAILAHKSGDTSKLRYRRDGQYLDTSVTFTPMPEQPPASQPATTTKPDPKARPVRWR